ncbi:MAG: efflux RND transporter permease subunit [Bradymonadaceae bacterium]
MIRGIINWSLDNPLIVAIFVVLTAAGGWWSVTRTPVDAIPDVSANQVIVETKWPGRGPKVIQDQITYPLSTTLATTPGVKDVRAISRFGYSIVYVIFQNGIDKYWARSRVLTKLNYAKSQLPDGVTPALGPDGTGVGHVFWYTLDQTGEKSYNLGKLREIQDYYVRYLLQEVEGVAEVASFGGFVKEYQIDLDPAKLDAYNVGISKVASAVKKSNEDTGGRILEQSQTEYVIRGKGYVENVEDLEQIVVKVDDEGVPITLDQLATVQMGTSMRRGVVADASGEKVGGIVVMRYGANAKAVIDRVKEAIDGRVEPGLPKGLEIGVAYDRSHLIEKSVETLTHKLVEEAIVVSIIILLFLFHARSALVVILTLPLAVLIAFICMKWLGITSNIMSLGGIAIALGVIVDASIVLVENSYRMLAEHSGEDSGEGPSRIDVLKRACGQVGPAIFFSMLIIIASFLPVFALPGRSGKMFTPLAWTKTLTMVGSTLLAVTVVPVLLSWFVRGDLKPLEDNVVARNIVGVYRPVLDRILRFPMTVLVAAGLLMASVYPLYSGLHLDIDGDGKNEIAVEAIGSEFMPPLDEGSILYMPVTLPNVGVSEAKRLMMTTNKIFEDYPEVKDVLGKVGRANTSTDPAPVAMIETIVRLEPKSKWREGLTKREIISDLNKKIDIPGLTNGWTQPIINRINMLSTGIRTDLGLKIYGPDLKKLKTILKDAEEIIRGVEGARDVFSERILGGHYIDIEPDRQALARYGLTVEDVNQVVETAIGGMPLTETVEGLSRFPVRVRYARDYRNSIEKLRNRVVVTGKNGVQVPLKEVATVQYKNGPPQIKSENGQLKAQLLFNVRGRDTGSFVADAKRAIDKKLELPEKGGYHLEWSGNWEAQKRAQQRLSILIPAAVLIILVLLYFAFSTVVDPLVVLLTVPFSVVGGLYLQYALGLNFSVAAWVGYISLFGVAVEMGVVMLLYLHEALDEKIESALDGGHTTPVDPEEADGELVSSAIEPEEIDEATLKGAALRVRPVLMTGMMPLFGLMPILWATGTGSGVMKPIATPMVGGIISALIVVLVVIPVVFNLIARYRLRRDTLTYSGLGGH